MTHDVQRSFGLRVVSVSASDVRDIMRELAVQCVSSGLKPSYVMAVLDGGRVPAMEFAAALRAQGLEPTPLAGKLSRRTTGSCKLRAAQVIARLPVVAQNFVRRAEHTSYRLRDRLFKRFKSGLPSPPESLIKYLAEQLCLSRVGPMTPVLIVDDAIDSGATLMQMVTALRVVGVERENVRIACITETTRNPVVRADYVKHRGVLCRFPWSGDARQSKASQ